jgi:hypothetical protein
LWTGRKRFSPNQGRRIRGGGAASVTKTGSPETLFQQAEDDLGDVGVVELD